MDAKNEGALVNDNSEPSLDEYEGNVFLLLFHVTDALGFVTSQRQSARLNLFLIYTLRCNRFRSFLYFFNEISFQKKIYIYSIY